MKQYLREYFGREPKTPRATYVRNLPHETEKAYAKRYFRKYPARYLLRIAKARAQKYGLDFDLCESDIAIPETCPILGLHLEVASTIRGNPCSASLDRIDNTRGYVSGNVQVISLLANQMKSTANAEQLRSFARWVTATYG